MMADQHLPLPDDVSARALGFVDIERDALRCQLRARREVIARSWQRALALTGLAEVSPTETHGELVRLTGEAITLLLAKSFAPARARALGAAVVRLRYFAPDALRGTLQILGQQLVADFTAAQLADLQPRLTPLLGEIATGFMVMRPIDPARV